jgi:8-oxo-dGTP diphosphatase
MCSSEIESGPRKNPMASSSFRSPSVVIFDIDDTILDVTQRYKDAVRAGYIDKERGTKRKKTFETPGKARKRAMEFLFSPDNLRKDRVVPGSIALINTLMEQGHTIVYVTARNAKYRDVTRTQLEDKGFPIFKDDTDMELLFFKANLSDTAEKYKQGVYAKLLSKYDVRMVFDDKAENLQMAAGLGITGLYPTIRDYTKYQVKSNPHAFYSSIVDDKGYPKEDPDEEPYQSYRSHSDESGMGRTGYSANNPGGIQSKVESILIKEGGAAGLKPLKAAFPKGTTKAQAQAAIAKMSSVYQHPAGDYILKNPGHTENYMVPRDIHRLGKAADRLEETYEDGLDTPEWWKSKLSVTAKDADTIADSLDYVAENPLPLRGLSVQVKGYRNTAGAFVMKGKKFLILQRSKKETSKHGLWELPGGKVEKGETPRETAVIETQEEAGLDVTLKVNLGPHIDDKKKKVYHAYIATPKKGQKVKISEEHVSHKWVTPEEVMAMPKKMVSHHLLYFLKKESEAIRSNPPKNKIEKGKKLYEHMNGKAPEKIEKKKIDMGDVWYQVGEGGCWQIGYMSGKETGKTEQKYTHTFNEETKDGNFPKLYATMPENGKPLLIIQGGTWKIRTDDKGVAWIYD